MSARKERDVIQQIAPGKFREGPFEECASFMTDDGTDSTQVTIELEWIAGHRGCTVFWRMSSRRERYLFTMMLRDKPTRHKGVSLRDYRGITDCVRNNVAALYE